MIKCSCIPELQKGLCLCSILSGKTLAIFDGQSYLSVDNLDVFQMVRIYNNNAFFGLCFCYYLSRPHLNFSLVWMLLENISCLIVACVFSRKKHLPMYITNRMAGCRPQNGLLCISMILVLKNYNALASESKPRD